MSLLQTLWLWAKVQTPVLAAPTDDDTSVSLWMILVILAIVALVIWIVVTVFNRRG